MGKKRKKLDINSGVYQARLQYEAMLLIDAASGDEHAGDAAYEALWAAGDRGDVDPVHVAQLLATMLLGTFKRDPNWRAVLDRTLEETRLIAAAEIPDAD